MVSQLVSCPVPRGGLGKIPIIPSFEELADLLGKRGGEPRQIERSRGGLTTKIHAAVDGAGLPLGMHLTAGQMSNCKNAPKLLESLEEGTRVVADKAYVTNAIFKQVSKASGSAVIPSRMNGAKQRNLYKEVYAHRNAVYADN